MIDAVLSVLALLAGGLALEVYGAARPPLGYEAEQGFRLDAEAHEPAEDRPSAIPS